MKKFLSFLLLLVISNLVIAQNDPVAVNDTVTTMSEQTIAVSVLLNDYDPDGDEFEIRSVGSPQHGEKDYNESTVFYTPDLYVGLDSLRYRIREVDNSSSSSEYAWVFFNVIENPNIPLANDDVVEILQLVPTEIEILDNDLDPNGDYFIIDEAYAVGYPYVGIELSEDSLSIILTSTYPLEYELAEVSYRVKEKNTEEAYYSDWATITVNIIENQDIPIAIDDNVNTTGGEVIDIYVLNNDINPGSSQIEIESVGESMLGTVEIVGDHLRYIPEYSQNGVDQLSYKIILADKPYLYDFGQVVINVANNPGRPVALDDEGSGVCGGETIVEVLQNDYDPEGTSVVIKDMRVVYPSSSLYVLEDIGTSIRVTNSPGITVNTERILLVYSVQEVGNPDSYSENATVTINMEQNADFPIFNNDYGSTIAGFPIEIDIIANDVMNGYNPEIMISGNDYGTCQFNDRLTFTSYMATSGLEEITYWVNEWEEGYFSFGEIEIEIIPNNSYDSLDINNISAGVHSDGYLFNKYGGPQGDSYDWSHFEFPKGSGKHTIFCNALWIGGVDQDDNLHLAAQRYKQVGLDFQFGPISNSYEGIEFFTKWSRLWKISKEEINYHKNNYWKVDYIPVDPIINWPGNGDVSNGQEPQLAPYFDSNENGIYEPLSGDYPLIRGDQSIYFIFNDDMIHTETEGEKLEVEVQGMAYAFNEPEDNMLSNTIFVHYDIYNRSENTYIDTYLGLFTDFDIGYAWDDYVGCNVGLGSYYGYNGRLIDGNGEPEAYGVNPPTQSVTIVAGPTMDEDNSDNPNGECDYSINGLNFGDGIVDNERFGMTKFIYFNNSGSVQGDPGIAPQYYNYLSGLWKDNTPMMYGGVGWLDLHGTVGPECSFMFPGDSDPCNWGTAGQLPNDGYNQDGKYWTEETGNLGNPNPPGDRRGLGATGPFTFEPGERQELELAYSVAQGDDGPQSSSQQLFDNLGTLFQLVDEGQIIIPSDQLSVDEKTDKKIILNIYPNPVKDVVYIEVDGEVNNKFKYYIYNNHGKLAISGKLSSNNINSIDIQKLDLGFYIVKVQEQGIVHSGKFIKM